MKSKTQNNRDLCAEPSADDGVPPHVLARRSRSRSPGSLKAGRHRLDQLCKQVRIALSEALVCDCGDPAIQTLELISVVPSTGSTVFEVTLRLPSAENDGAKADLAAIEHALRQLERASGLLRAATAAAIHRKRVPQLRFRVIV